MKVHIGDKTIIVKLRLFIVLIGVLVIGIGSYYFLVFKNTNQTIFKTIENGKITTAHAPQKEDQLQKLKEQYRNKFVIVFFYDGYSSSQEALLNVQILKSTLGIVEPFKSMGNSIVYKIFTTDSQKCNVKESGGLKLLVCDKNLILSFKRLGIDHFKLVIISPLEFSSTAQVSRGGNSWMTLSTYRGNLSTEEFNRFLGLQFSQSLGKSLGLASEGDATASGQLRASSLIPLEPNCAKDQDTAKIWWGGYTSVYNNVAYFKGCNGNPDFYYPEENTIMSQTPKKESYGRVSEDYLRQALSCYYLGQEKVGGSAATYSATLSSCGLFKAQYPLFWEE